MLNDVLEDLISEELQDATAGQPVGWQSSLASQPADLLYAHSEQLGNVLGAQDLCVFVGHPPILPTVGVL